MRQRDSGALPCLAPRRGRHRVADTKRSRLVSSWRSALQVGLSLPWTTNEGHLRPPGRHLHARVGSRKEEAIPYPRLVDHLIGQRFQCSLPGDLYSFSPHSTSLNICAQRSAARHGLLSLASSRRPAFCAVAHGVEAVLVLMLPPSALARHGGAMPTPRRRAVTLVRKPTGPRRRLARGSMIAPAACAHPSPRRRAEPPPESPADGSGRGAPVSILRAGPTGFDSGLGNITSTAAPPSSGRRSCRRVARRAHPEDESKSAPARRRGDTRWCPSTAARPSARTQRVGGVGASSTSVARSSGQLLKGPATGRRIASRRSRSTSSVRRATRGAPCGDLRLRIVWEFLGTLVPRPSPSPPARGQGR